MDVKNEGGRNTIITEETSFSSVRTESWCVAQSLFVNRGVGGGSSLILFLFFHETQVDIPIIIIHSGPDLLSFMIYVFYGENI